MKQPAAAKAKSDSKPILGIFSKSRGSDARVKELEKQVEELTSQLDEARKPTAKADSFALQIEAAEKSIDELIQIKTDDCKNEKGKERENERKLGMLQTMQYMIHGIGNTIDNWNREFKP
jgi:predicted RNase H-like nuclease (RuvC/YqgF family)